jgi:ABC-2 type transport system ATP-binding protein
MTDPPSVVRAEALAKSYGQIEAVRGIDLDVRAGEAFGFLGPNGAGKSTTIGMLCTLIRPTGGRAAVAGHDVSRQAGAVRARIGLVFQDPSLDDQLTARENLEFHAFVYNVPRSQRRRRIDQVLETVELTNRAGSLVRTYSGGMKRRLEIARGILHHPQVLFLDEPTLGLDPQTRNHIWAHLGELRRREGITIFMTTHYMDEAEFCDRIAIIDHGTIVAQGTPDELKSMVGGDVVTLTTDDDERAAAEIRERFELEPVRSGDGLRLEVADGAAFVPRLVRELGVPVRTVAVRRPSLDDVFLKLTGRAIRDEEADARDRMRMFGARWGARRR